MQRQKGFTIVELLIVIVVIGVLAALVMNSFASAQKKARNAQTATAVKAYKAALYRYGAEKGAYPAGNTSGCLGEGYPYGCWPAAANTTFNDDIRPYMNNANPLPAANTRPIEYYGTRSGAALHVSSTRTYDGVPNPWAIVYFIEGTDPCPVGPVAGYTTDWQTNISSNPNNYTERYQGKNTMCIIVLPDPATL